MTEDLNTNIEVLDIDLEKNLSLIHIQMCIRDSSYRRPEPYKGKGVRYEGEYIRRKVGKTGKQEGVKFNVKAN